MTAEPSAVETLTEAEREEMYVCPVCGSQVSDHTHLTRSIRESNPEARKVCDRSVLWARAAAFERILATRLAAARADERAKVLAEVEKLARRWDPPVKPGVIGWWPEPHADALRALVSDLRAEQEES